MGFENLAYTLKQISINIINFFFRNLRKIIMEIPDATTKLVSIRDDDGNNVLHLSTDAKVVKSCCPVSRIIISFYL